MSVLCSTTIIAQSCDRVRRLIGFQICISAQHCLLRRYVSCLFGARLLAYNICAIVFRLRTSRNKMFSQTGLMLTGCFFFWLSIKAKRSRFGDTKTGAPGTGDISNRLVHVKRKITPEKSVGSLPFISVNGVV